MYTYEATEARALVEWALDNLHRSSGLGDLIIKVETATGATVGHSIERDGESSQDGILLGGMPPGNEHHHVRWADIVWIGFGYEE